MHGLDPEIKYARAANYITTLRRDLLKVSGACGVSHPGLITVDDIDILNGHESATPLSQVYGYEPGWGVAGPEDRVAIAAIMANVDAVEQHVRRRLDRTDQRATK